MTLSLAWFVLSATATQTGWPDAVRSHPPMRDLPEPVRLPPPTKPTYHVDATGGSDENPGSRSAPWKTVQHAVGKLQAGDTLLLRGGTYHEQVTLTNSGTVEKPITIRSCPGELAVLDGGFREFAESPATAWEVVNAAAGEFRSTKPYPGLEGIVLGNFADSMVPLHGYRHRTDLLSTNEFWTLTNKLDAATGIYCGPGLWLDPATRHIHARLAHHTLKILGDDGYHGETDPRKLPLVVGGARATLQIEGAKHVRIQGMVVRGSSRATILVSQSEAIEFDGVTAYGGSTALSVEGTRGLRLVNCALRSIAAPWSGRGHLKYRGVAAYLMTVRDGCGDFEIAYSELTDGHDGPFIGTVKGLKFHHNLVDNFNDDGIYLMAMGEGGDLRIYQNRLSRCLHIFAFAGKYPIGSGVQICRNVIDLRRPVFYGWPASADDPLFLAKDTGQPQFPPGGWLCGDHGSPTWEPICFYHNTVISQTHGDYRAYYAAGWAGHTAGTRRRVFNNIFVQIEELPTQNFFAVSPDDDFQADGNLLWGVREGPAQRGDVFAGFRESGKFEASKKQYPPGWGANDRFADPKFARFVQDGTGACDLRLAKTSPAVNAGVAIPADWPDPLRASDKTQPDLGALPVGTKPWGVGVNGRYSVFEGKRQ